MTWQSRWRVQCAIFRQVCEECNLKGKTDEADCANQERVVDFLARNEVRRCILKSTSKRTNLADLAAFCAHTPVKPCEGEMLAIPTPRRGTHRLGCAAHRLPGP